MDKPCRLFVDRLRRKYRWPLVCMLFADALFRKRRLTVPYASLGGHDVPALDREIEYRLGGRRRMLQWICELASVLVFWQSPPGRLWVPLRNRPRKIVILNDDAPPTRRVLDLDADDSSIRRVVDLNIEAPDVPPVDRLPDVEGAPHQAAVDAVEVLPVCPQPRVWIEGSRPALESAKGAYAVPTADHRQSKRWAGRRCTGNGQYADLVRRWGPGLQPIPRLSPDGGRLD